MQQGFAQYFPNIYSSQTNETYLDSAASTHKLASVINATETFYSQQYASVNRSAYASSSQATQQYEMARQGVQSLIDAKTSDEIVFTSGATESLNMIAMGLHSDMFQGDTVLVMARDRKSVV